MSFLQKMLTTLLTTCFGIQQDILAAKDQGVAAYLQPIPCPQQSHAPSADSCPPVVELPDPHHLCALAGLQGLVWVSQNAQYPAIVHMSSE